MVNTRRGVVWVIAQHLVNSVPALNADSHSKNKLDFAIEKIAVYARVH